jgi:ABC-type phosphate transport system substrate-binding protein
MRYTTRVKAGLGVAGAAALMLGLAAPSASADYAPSRNDVVGVGSDTVQYAIDFLADGDFLADAGYNGAGNKNKLVNFDATPDANARLAYGAAGTGPNCAPGTGKTPGTGNQNTTHTDTPCILNPTLVLRSGKVPVTRVNGSGAGKNAILADTTSPFQIDFTRSSSTYGTLPAGSPQLDSIQLGTDNLAILSSSTTNAVALNTAQLAVIYSCGGTGTGGATFWDDPRIGGSSHTLIKPLIPQVGSGTRSTFLGAIGLADVSSACNVATVEENDPEAIDASGSPADAIEPMSSGRLNLFKGLLSDGTANGKGGYFQDPSCLFNVATPAACVGAAKTLNPNVRLWNQPTDVPGGSLAGALYNAPRGLYVYFRHSDINSTKKFQSNAQLNWVRTLFYNPCDGFIPGACVTVNGTQYGPGGQPYIATDFGQALISAAGIVPTYTYTAAGP